MATALSVAWLSRRCRFLILVVLLGYFHKASCYAPTIEVSCRSTINLANYDAGLIVSHLPERIPIFANEDERCDIMLSVPEGYLLMFYFEWLDFYSGELTNCDNTNVELFDGASKVYVTDLKRKVCGREEEMPTQVFFLNRQNLIIQVNAPGIVQGSGFKIHFTVARRSFPCSTDEFACDTYGTRRCIAEHLVCDDWNDCGDWADEEQNCNILSGGGIAAIVLTSIGLVALIIGLIIFCKLRSERELRELGVMKDSSMMRDTSAASGGFASPYSVSIETLEKERYTPRYSSGRNSGRRGRDFGDQPPPYTEKPMYDSSRSEEGMFDEDDRPRSRGSKHRSRQDPDDVFKEEDEAPRGRRGRSRSQDRESVTRGRPKYNDAMEAEEDEEEGDKRARYPPKDSARNYDRYQRDRDDRHPPSRRDDEDSLASDRLQLPRTTTNGRDNDSRFSREGDRYPNRRDDRERDRDRDRDSDSRHSSRDDYRDRDRERDRDRDRYPSGRRDDRDRDSDSRYSRDDYRDRDRERDRDRDRDRYPSRRDDRDSDGRYSGRDDDRYPSRRPDDRDRDRDSYRERDRDREREKSRERDRERERDRDRDRDQGSRRDRPGSQTQRDEPEDDYVDQLHPLRDLKRRSTHSDSDQDTSRDSDKRTPDRDRDRPRDDDRSSRAPRSSSSRDDRSPADKPRDTPASRRGPASPAADDNYESFQPAPVSSSRAPRASRPESRDPAPAQSPTDDNPEFSAEDQPSRRRRRRSRSREGQERPRSSRYKDAEDEGGAGRQGRTRAEEEPRGGRSSGRQSMGGVGGYMEETV